MLKKHLRVLNVEDNPVDSELAARTLKDVGYDVEWTRVETDAEFESALAFCPEIVIADGSLPQFTVPLAIKILRRAGLEIPFIVVSGGLDEEKAMEALRLGADDCVPKQWLDGLPAAVERAVERVRLKRDKAEAEARLRQVAAMAGLAHWTSAPDGATESWSETLAELIGANAGRLPGRVPVTMLDWQGSIHPNDRAVFRDRYLAAGVSRQRTEARYRMRAVGGRWIHVRHVMEPLAPNRSGGIRWLNALQDSSELAAAEQRIGRLNRVRAMQSGINAAIFSARSRQDLFEQCCSVAVGVGQFQMAWIGVVDSAASTVQAVAVAGDVHGLVETAPMPLSKADAGGPPLVGRAIRTGSPAVWNDVESEPPPRTRTALAAHGIGSHAVIPLMIDRRPVGLLALYAAEAGYFDAEEMLHLADLARSISLALGLLERTERLDYVSHHDVLTGLPNRALFHEQFTTQLQSVTEDDGKVGLLMLDIERFSTVNDTYGRTVGDAVLKEVANRIRAGLYPRSWAARLGGDQFAIVVPGLETEEELGRRIEKRFAEMVGAPFSIAGTEIRLSARVGIAFYPVDGTDADAALRSAEAALKEAKASGERFLFSTQEMRDRIAENLAIEGLLRRAVEREELELHYQPKMDREGKHIVGVEALLRWQCPELGEVPTIRFLPLLEETGLILQVGAWALRRAALDHRNWVVRGLKTPRVAVNVSQVQLRQRDFVHMVSGAVAGIDPIGIDVEVTESFVMEDAQGVIAKLNAVHAMGINIAIDHFGTGYSALAHLARLPLETLKIDSAYTAAMLDDPDTMTIVRTIISLAHALELKVVAEGVERPQQARVLRLLGCDQMQGHLFSAPLPHRQLTALLETGDLGGR